MSHSSRRLWLAHHAPIIATTLGLSGTAGQVIRMCVEHSALGQEPLSWVLAQLNWWMWIFVHRTLNRQQTFVVLNAYLGAAASFITFLVVCYWRWWVK